jgi:hypothetical protein
MKLNLFFALFIFCKLMFAQEHRDREAIEPIGDSPFSIGPKGGCGHSFLSAENNYLYHPSWSIGLGAMYSPSEHWAFCLDALFSTEGATLKNDVLNNKIRLDYFRVPFKIMYFFRKYESDLRPKIGIGPVAGILLNKKGNDSTADAGAVISAGFNYRLIGGVWLTLDANYYHGLINVYESSPQNNSQNRYARLDIGIMLGF